MKNVRLIIVVFALMITGVAIAGQKAVHDNKQCNANKTEANFSPQPDAYKKLSPTLAKYLPNLLTSDNHNASAKCIPASGK